MRKLFCMIPNELRSCASSIRVHCSTESLVMLLEATLMSVLKIGAEKTVLCGVHAIAFKVVAELLLLIESGALCFGPVK